VKDVNKTKQHKRVTPTSEDENKQFKSLLWHLLAQHILEYTPQIHLLAQHTVEYHVSPTKLDHYGIIYTPLIPIMVFVILYLLKPSINIFNYTKKEMKKIQTRNNTSKCHKLFRRSVDHTSKYFYAELMPSWPQRNLKNNISLSQIEFPSHTICAAKEVLIL
jgi:hypothetical protein